MPILSICIPTKNHAQYLDYVLTSIVRQKRFQETDDVEIVVSDNGSTDVTEEICKNYPVKYIKMEEPTFRAEPNYLNVLKNSNGMFRKLHNDNMVMVDGALDIIIDIISIADQSVVFFPNSPDRSRPDIVKCLDFDSFIRHVSYQCTWIGGFGIWKKDFPAIEKIFLRNKDTILCQVDMLREMIVGWGRDIIICNKFMFGDLKISKGGLNIAEIFGQNYLNLIADYISMETFRNEREKLLKEFIIPYYFDRSGQHHFERTGFFKYMKHYWNDEFFYEEIEKLLMEGRHE